MFVSIRSCGQQFIVYIVYPMNASVVTVSTIDVNLYPMLRLEAQPFRSHSDIERKYSKIY